MNKDYFAHKARDYEQNERRVTNVDNIAQAIINSTSLDKSMELMDFGAGTGLLLGRIAPHVGKITAVDVSKSMIEALEGKRDQIGCELDIREVNLESECISATFDGIISSMTLHHIQDVAALFKTLFTLTNEGGFIALADLDKEDGSFHTEDTGVHHFGFDRAEVTALATDAGFRKVKVIDASVIQKPQGEFGVFLLTAQH